MQFKRNKMICAIFFATVFYCELSSANWENGIEDLFRTFLFSLVAGGVCSALYYKFKPQNSELGKVFTVLIFILTTLLFGRNFAYAFNFNGMASEFFEVIDPRIKFLNLGYILSFLLALFGPLLGAYLASRKRLFLAALTAVGLIFTYFYPEYCDLGQEIGRCSYDLTTMEISPSATKCLMTTPLRKFKFNYWSL